METKLREKLNEILFSERGFRFFWVFEQKVQIYLVKEAS